MEKSTPSWVKWALIFCVAVIIVLIAIIARQSRKSYVKDKQTEHKAITREIDSLEAKRDKKQDSIVDKSQSNAEKAQTIIKNLPSNESIKINDTIGGYAIDYVRGFRADR